MPKIPGIKRLGRDYYFVQVSRTDPRTGKRRFKRKWVNGPYSDAVDARKEALAELDAEIRGLTAERLTLTGYAQRWLEAKASSLKPSTKAKYVNDLERHILPKLGHVEIAELRPRDVEKMLARDKGAPNSKKNRLTLLRAIAKDAQADDVTPRDFCARVSVTVPDVYTDDEPNLLDPEQLGRLLDEIPRYWLDLACTLSYTGLRWGEVSAFHWDAIDFEQGSARVKWTNWKGLLQPPKNRRANRVVPLVKPLPEILRERRRRMVAEQHPGLRHGLVFPTAEGTLHKGTPLAVVLREACERAGIAIRFTPHGLRRTWNDLARRVADGMVVRAMIGHADEAMTEHYSRVDVEEKRKAAEAVARLVPTPERPVTVPVAPEAPTPGVKRKKPQ